MATSYYLDGDQIAWQTDGTNTIHFVYDDSGNPVYMLSMIKSKLELTLFGQ